MSSPRFDVISIFPEYLAPLKLSLVGKAQENQLIDVGVTDLRDFAEGLHKSVDDTPYGGGAGMVMSPEPWAQAIDSVVSSSAADHHELIILTPAGKKFDQKMAYELSTSKHLIFACGRYEGIDYRVTDHYRAENNITVREISIGDYVLNGGEVAALVVLEAVIRLIPGVIGNPASLEEESHSLKDDNDVTLVEYPSYTKPAQWRGLEIPPVLLSGNHGEIAKWRAAQSEIRTRKLSE
jgi:tRNA (guanine37-N1)-methyltransferase